MGDSACLRIPDSSTGYLSASTLPPRGRRGPRPYRPSKPLGIWRRSKSRCPTETTRGAGRERATPATLQFLPAGGVMTRRTLHLTIATLGLAAALHAQQASPAFDVASVKRNLAGDPRAGGPTALGRIPPNGISYTNYTLPMLISTAYGVREDWISGGPAWVRTARFDVVARAGSEVS